MVVSVLMENLQDMLLEHVVPDQVGQLGKVNYSFTEMKIVHVHWPKVSSVEGLFLANNGALRLQGKYEIQRPGVLGYHKSGEFIFDLGAICLSIKDNSNADTQSTSSSSSRHSNRHSRHQHNHDRHRTQPHDVTCSVGHIKVKFHGGAARVCQFLTSLYIKVYRRHLEAQIAKVIQETVQDDGQVLMSALSVMASVNGSNNETTTDNSTTQPPHLTHSSSSSGQESGTFQRFFDSFSRSSTNT